MLMLLALVSTRVEDIVHLRKSRGQAEGSRNHEWSESRSIASPLEKKAAGKWVWLGVGASASTGRLRVERWTAGLGATVRTCPRSSRPGTDPASTDRHRNTVEVAQQTTQDKRGRKRDLHRGPRLGTGVRLTDHRATAASGKRSRNVDRLPALQRSSSAWIDVAQARARRPGALWTILGSKKPLLRT